MRTRILIPAVLALTTGFVAVADAASIRKVRVGKHDDIVRIVFHTDEALGYAVTTGDGSTVQLEISGVTEAGPDPSPALSIKYAPVTGIEYQVSEEGVTAVISASGPVHAKSFSLKPDYYGGHRIVVDLARNAKNLESQIEPAVITKKELQTHSTPPPASRSSASPSSPSASETQSASRGVNDTLRGTGDPCGSHKRKLESNQWDMTELIDYAGCLRDGGKLLDAKAVYEKILAFDPDFHRARLAVAEIYTYLGLVDQAKAAYEHVLFSDPPPDVVKRIQSALDALPAIQDRG